LCVKCNYPRYPNTTRSEFRPLLLDTLARAAKPSPRLPLALGSWFVGTLRTVASALHRALPRAGTWQATVTIPRVRTTRRGRRGAAPHD
jgi:hypothetical protein